MPFSPLLNWKETFPAVFYCLCYSNWAKWSFNKQHNAFFKSRYSMLASYFLWMQIRHEFWRHSAVFTANVSQVFSTSQRMRIISLRICVTWRQNSCRIRICRKYEPGFSFCCPYSTVSACLCCSCCYHFSYRILMLMLSALQCVTIALSTVILLPCSSYTAHSVDVM